MRKPARLLPLFAVILALSLAGCGGDADETPTAVATETAITETAGPSGATGLTLRAEVGSSDNEDAYQIHLRDASGNDVTILPPGDYTIKVEDHSAVHNFHLTGPGTDETTAVGDTGEVVWQVTFAAGDYIFICDPHSTAMQGSFTVG